MEASPPQQNSAKNQCGEEEPPIDDVNIWEEIPQEDSGNDLTIENAAFSQYLILKNILSFLNQDDLENCRCVSRHWKEVGKTLVSVHYHIYWDIQKSVQFITKTNFNQGILRRCKLDLKDATKTLESALLTHNGMVVLSVKLRELDFDRRNSSVEDFLLKFGPLVQHLRFSDYYGVRPTISSFCNFLLTYFPNLKSLKCRSSRFEKDSTGFEDFNPELAKYQLKQLKKIQFGWVDSNFETWVLLKIGPNLEEIIKFPLECVNALLIADKVQLLKSIFYSLTYGEAYYAKKGLTVESAFEKLAQLQPKLTFFSLDLNICSWEYKSTLETVKPLIFSILESSADSLRTFEIHATKYWGFQNMPQLKGVKTLVFKEFSENRMYSPCISVEKTFPNVREMRLLFCPWDKLIHCCLPEIMNSSWGSQIKRLEVNDLPLSSLPTLQKLFPLIEDLKFIASVTELAELLREFPKFCPLLKSLTISIAGGSSPPPKLLDCAFSGLSPDVVAQLLDPAQRGVFSDAQIEGFKSQSPFSKLTALRRLSLTVVWEPMLKTLTHVSAEFGFRLVPHLKVYVDDCDEYMLPHWSHPQ